MQGLEFVVVAAMVIVNAVFAAYEIALASISVARLQLLAQEKRRGARSALEMKQGIEKSLAVVQLGITLVGAIAGAAGGASASEDLAPAFVAHGMKPIWADVAAMATIVAPLTILTIVVGELVPKLFALRHKEWVCLRLSPAMKGFSFAVWPLVWLLETAASLAMDLFERIWKPNAPGSGRSEAAEIQELRAITGLARASRLIGAREENIILGAARLASRKVAEIAIPAENIRMLGIDQTLSECLATAHRDMHTRFPVAIDPSDPQTICGYVTFKDIVAAEKMHPGDPPIRSILRPILSIPAAEPISNALERLLREHSHIALVRDADNLVVGMITLEDILEELIGDINDEYDLLPNHIVRAGKGWIVGGGATPKQILEATGAELPDAQTSNNLSGWILDRLGDELVGGNLVRAGKIRIAVRKTRRLRILEAWLFVD